MMRPLEAVAQVARLAGDKALSHFRGPVRVEQKGDGTPVTEADRGAELVAREWIEKHFPADGILGEELGTTRPGARRRWILDPIDGTKAFIRGVPLWGTLVALAEGEEVLAGAIYVPALNELVVAEKGAGCFWNDTRCQVSEVASLSQATVLTTEAGRLAPLVRELMDAGAVARTWGDCYGYLLVATGRAELMVDSVLAPWDSAALCPVIEEAGGVFTDLSGRRQAMGGSAVASNRRLAEEVRQRLQGHPSPG